MTEKTLLMLVIAATWGGMFTVIKLAEMKKEIRNRILGIGNEGAVLTATHMRMLLQNDYTPLAVGIWIFLAALSVSIGAAPLVFSRSPMALLENAPGLLLVSCCLGIAVFGVFAMALDLRTTSKERAVMLAHIDDVAAKMCDESA